VSHTKILLWMIIFLSNGCAALRKQQEDEREALILQMQEDAFQQLLDEEAQAAAAEAEKAAAPAPPTPEEIAEDPALAEVVEQTEKTEEEKKAEASAHPGKLGAFLSTPADGKGVSAQNCKISTIVSISFPQVRAVFGVGSFTEGKLCDEGITTAKDLISLSRECENEEEFNDRLAKLDIKTGKEIYQSIGYMKDCQARTPYFIS